MSDCFIEPLFVLVNKRKYVVVSVFAKILVLPKVLLTFVPTLIESISGLCSFFLGMTRLRFPSLVAKGGYSRSKARARVTEVQE